MQVEMEAGTLYAPVATACHSDRAKVAVVVAVFSNAVHVATYTTGSVECKVYALCTARAIFKKSVDAANDSTVLRRFTTSNVLVDELDSTWTHPWTYPCEDKTATPSRANHLVTAGNGSQVMSIRKLLIWGVTLIQITEEKSNNSIVCGMDVWQLHEAQIVGQPVVHHVRKKQRRSSAYGKYSVIANPRCMTHAVVQHNCTVGPRTELRVFLWQFLHIQQIAVTMYKLCIKHEAYTRCSGDHGAPIYLAQAGVPMLPLLLGFDDESSVHILVIGYGMGQEWLTLLKAYPTLRVTGYESNIECHRLVNKILTEDAQNGGSLSQRGNFLQETWEPRIGNDATAQEYTHVWTTATSGPVFYERLLEYSANLANVTTVCAHSDTFWRTTQLGTAVYRTISPPQAGGNFTKQLTAVDLTPDFRQNVLGTLTQKKATEASCKGKGRAGDAYKNW